MTSPLRVPVPIGRPRSPRRLLNQPAFSEAVKASSYPAYILAIVAGIHHYRHFSELIHADEIPATRTNLQRLERIADAVGFPVADIFLPDGEGDGRG